MGVPEGSTGYPDESYVLTTDNVKKIMAIYMRFRCGIPVIIMGETGCGKTRLIKFMCDLQKPSDGPDIQNMILMKVCILSDDGMCIFCNLKPSILKRYTVIS